MNATALHTRILFACTGNSCRSQMAEGWARALGGDRFEARSAGIEPKALHPLAVRVMAECGVDIGAHRSKALTSELLAWADVVVTVCGHADEHCPLLPPGVQKRHWPITDPARAEGDEAQVLAVFRAVRDELHTRVAELVEELEGGGHAGG